MTALAALVAVIGGLAGAALLRRAWADRQHERASLIVSGWAALAATVVLDAAWAGCVKASAVAVAGIGLATLIDPCANEPDTLQRLYDLHPLAVEDALKDGQLPARCPRTGCRVSMPRLGYTSGTCWITSVGWRQWRAACAICCHRCSSSATLSSSSAGAITRQLAAWAAILAVPTAIVGIYGMNVEHMPELRSPYGYPITIGVILTICSALYWRFRKAR